MMNIDKLCTQFEELYRGGNWLEENFQGKLQPLSDETAFTPPMQGVHSVAEILWHCIYWRILLLKTVEGDPSYREQTFEKFNFRTLEDLKSETFKHLLEQLDDSQEKIIAMLKTKDDDFLLTEYKPGFTFDHLIKGVLEHDSYHLGQIGLVLKMLRVKSSIVN